MALYEARRLMESSLHAALAAATPVKKPRAVTALPLGVCAAGRVVTFSGPQGADEAAAVVKALSNQPFEPAGGRTMVARFAKWVPEGDAGEEEAQQVSGSSWRLGVWDVGAAHCSGGS